MQEVLLIGEVAVESSAPVSELRTPVPDRLTLGLEEELILVDPRSLSPLPAIETALERLPAGRFQPELRAAQIELVTPVCTTAAQLLREVTAARSQVVDALGGSARLLAAGTHPTAYGPVEIADRARYRGVARDYPWAVRRGLPCGLHVHVGLSDPDELLAVYNAARSYLPELAALAASSPFFEGSDSALASSRLKLVEDFPRAGTPPAFARWEEFREFVAWGSAAGLFPDLTYLWWDLRPRPDLGTVEFRVADVQTRPEDAVALAALVQSLVAALQLRRRAGERLPILPTHVIAENRWRAVRDGVDADLVDPRTGRRQQARDRLARLLLELEPYADELGCDAELALAWPLLARNGAIRQRAVAASAGLRGLLLHLVDETEHQ